MEEKDTNLRDAEGEETMVAPRFDDEETVLARPVVPLEEVGDAPAAGYAPRAAGSPFYSRLREAPRRSLVVTLVLISALAGSVLGGAGLYLYQRHGAAPDSATQPQQQAEAPAPQPTAEPARQEPAQQQPLSEAEPRADDAPAPEAAQQREDEDSRPRESASVVVRHAEEDDAAPRARRDDAEEPAPSTSTKRGKKGDRDEDSEPRGSRRARRDDDEQLSREESDDDAPRARRVGTITYRQRRARPRRETSVVTADRLRRIFEGQP